MRGRYDHVEVALGGPAIQDAPVTVDLGGSAIQDAPVTVERTPGLVEIVEQEGEFLWLTLQRLGVRRDDCQDVVQNVLMVVHRKLHTYDGRAPLRAWLYGICAKEASVHRRRAWVRREQPVAADAMPGPQLAGPGDDPERAAQAREEHARLAAMLDELDPDKRAALVMYEVEERSCEEIAALQGVPVGTVHSRLHAARKSFRAVLDRWMKRDERGGRR